MIFISANFIIENLYYGIWTGAGKRAEINQFQIAQVAGTKSKNFEGKMNQININQYLFEKFSVINIKFLIVK